MLATIMCDASFCPETGAGGYGFWIATERGRQGGGQEFKSLLSSSLEAEMCAVVNSLVQAKNLNLLIGVDWVLFQIDCVSAIDRLINPSRCSNDTEKSISLLFQKKIADYGLRYKIKHVKGHTKGRDNRTRANNHCDKRAKAAMQARRQIERDKSADHSNS